MVKGHMLYVKIWDAGTHAVNAFISLQGRGLRTPQQSTTDHAHTMGQDGARRGILPPYLNNGGPHVIVRGKPAHPYQPPQKLSSEAKPVPQNSDPRNLLLHRPLRRQEYSRTNKKTTGAPTDLGKSTISCLDPLVM
jgi:hypothetical protein